MIGWPDVHIDLELTITPEGREFLELLAGPPCTRPCDSWCEAYSGCINQRPIRGELTA